MSDENPKSNRETINNIGRGDKGAATPPAPSKGAEWGARSAKFHFSNHLYMKHGFYQ